MSVRWRETLRGSYFTVEQPDSVHPGELWLDVELGLPAVASTRIVAEAQGRLTLDGLLADRVVQGQIIVHWLPRLRVSYELDVLPEAGDRSRLSLRAGLEPRVLRPLRSLTRLWGSLEDGGETIALVHLRFDVRRDLIESLHSLRFAWRR